MSEPKRSVYSGTPPSGPGIFLSLSKITNNKLLSDDLFNKWYNEVHLVDVLATGAVTRAYRYRNKNPEAERPYLALYICPDMSAIAGEKVKNIPMHSDLLPDGKSIHELVNFDTRFYSTTQEFVKKELNQQDLFPVLMLAGMQPKDGAAEDMDKWYREEHLEQMSLEPGWKRAVRYSLIFQVKNENDPTGTEDAASFLTLYEFGDGNKLGMNVEPLDPMTDWTKRVIGNTEKIEMGIYTQIKALP
ncbi:uncharacterized protein PV09_00810 [Verruconis gallopava]|uniref:EthD domain-containing protein n=1 Tax=Verruconis gallopava TaxID=253628 RepID=A0A0D2AQE7_9PEZI|nr:uncharacterized protein PV09_00810 [Verruconis gallopava]KIW08888.1 hypothetical protein PV09_00810 [Verruconis gallopava]